ncbi:hypothetical protein TNCV_4012081 [Trichonephila clavipes]|nr:hypothetical protein TNCV_4012081 [Trichonephila clavipes]
MTPPKRGKFPKNIPYHDVFMGTLPSSRRGKCVTLFGGVRGTPRNSSACKQQQGRYTNYCCNPYGKAAPITPPLSQINKTKMNNNKKISVSKRKYRIGLASANVYVKNKICRLLVHYQLSTSYEVVLSMFIHDVGSSIVAQILLKKSAKLQKKKNKNLVSQGNHISNETTVMRKKKIKLGPL